jgi:O-antigen ligase
VTLLTAFVVLLLVLPSRYVVGPLGAAGTPAQIFGLGAALWWAALWLARHRPATHLRQPVRQALLVFLASIMASYAVANLRPIRSEEVSSVDRGVLSVLAWTAVLLVAMDWIPSLERLNTLLRRLTLLGAAVAALGIVQYLTGQAYTDLLKLPGLSVNADLTSVGSRGDFFRPAGTALSPIEFGVVLSMILPIALHYAVVDQHRARWRRWAPVALIAVALPFAISRSAIVASFVALAILLPTWPRALRRRTLAGMVLLGVALFVGRPRMLGTVTGLFTGISGDASAQSRSDSYAIAWSFVVDRPILGRGFGTFTPEYRILDNQYLLSLIDTGIVGCAALVGLFWVGARTAFTYRRSLGDAPDHSIATAVSASIAAGAVSFLFFDALSFPQVPGMMFLMLGVSAALRRFLVEGGGDRLRETEKRLATTAVGAVQAPRRGAPQTSGVGASATPGRTPRSISTREAT